MSTTQNDTVNIGIARTIERSLQDAGYGSYNSYAGPVVEALVAREQDLSDKLIDYAVDAGADADEIREYLTGIGMSVKPEPEDEVDEDLESADDTDTGALGRIEQMLTSLTGRIDSLTAFARNNGYRG